MSTDLKNNFTITNHVIVVETRTRNDLTQLLERFGYGSYKPNIYSALIRKTEHDKNTLLIFKSGNMTSMGSESFFYALRELQMLKYKYNIDMVQIEVTNIVAKSSVDLPCDIHEIYERNKNVCLYDKSIFPCCTINVPSTNIKINLFSSGAMIITGCKNLTTIQESILFATSLIHPTQCR